MVGFSRTAAAVTSLLVCAFAGASSTFAQTASSPWLLVDVGAPALSGSAVLGSGAIVIEAACEGLRESSDQFTFVYQTLAGDIDVRVRIDDLASITQWSTAGVMIRAGLSAQAAHASTLWTAAAGAAFQRRSAAGALAVRSGTAPGRWVRLRRIGSEVTSYSSADGATWTALGTELLDLGTSVHVGLVLSSHDPAVRTTAWASNLSAVSLAPAGLASVDVGKPAITGRTTVTNGRYSIAAGGAGIGDPADQFHFVYQPVTGDVSITARIASISAAHKFSSAGVMIRESLDPSSPHALMTATATGGWSFRRRTINGGTSEQTDAGKGGPPGWVRLVRSGTQVDAFKSADGLSWTKTGTAAVPMGTTVYAGIAVSSRTGNKTTTAVVEGLKIVESAPAANRPPVVTLATSASGGALVQPATLDLVADASDSDGTVSAVEFYAGNTLLARLTAAPYVFTVAGLAAGTHLFRAVATDDEFASSISEPLPVQVEAPNAPPSVALTLASGSQTLTAPAAVSLAATASDVDGTVAGVRFFAGTVLLAHDTAAPFTYAVSGLQPGTYTFSAVAVDDDGASSEPVSMTVTVAAATQPPPSGIAFIVSADHATLVTGYTLEVYAAGATPGVSAPLRTLSLGKPAPDASGEVQLGCASFFEPLPAGSYIAAVVAVGASGSARSAVVPFTR